MSKDAPAEGAAEPKKPPEIFKYNTLDPEREKFVKSLKQTNVIEAMKNVLVQMYEEETQPADPIAYMRKHLPPAPLEDVEELRIDNEMIRLRVMELEEEKAKLEKTIEHYKQS
jgi:hypothetical protein